MSDDELVEQSRHIAGAIAAAEAELAAVLAEVERRGLHGSWDCSSIERFASWHCQLAPSRAAAIVTVGRALTELPVVAEAVVSGHLPLAKSAPIIAIAAPDTEAALVELATHATVSQTRRICASWRRAERVQAEATALSTTGQPVDPSIAQAGDETIDPALRSRVIVIRDHDGVELRARFDHVHGELVLASLDAAAARVRSERTDAAPAAEVAQSSPANSAIAQRAPGGALVAPGASGTSDGVADAQGARPASVDDIGRVRLTQDQWRAEGLLRLCETSPAACPTALQTSGFSAQVVVHIPVSTLIDPSMHADSGQSSRQSSRQVRSTEHTDDQLNGHTTEQSTEQTDAHATEQAGLHTSGQSTGQASRYTNEQRADRRPTTGDILEPSGARIERDAARWLACDAGLLTVIDTDSGDPLHLGRRTTTITPQQRRAVHTRFHSCAWPGCASTVVQVHHRHHRAFGGHDDIENLVAECRYHHALIHRHHITVTVDPDGTVHHRRPDGSEVTAGPPPGTAPPVRAGDGLTTLERRQSKSGIDPSDPLRMPQWAGDPFHLAECIDAIFARREAALRRTDPT